MYQVLVAGNYSTPNTYDLVNELLNWNCDSMIGISMTNGNTRCYVEVSVYSHWLYHAIAYHNTIVVTDRRPC